VAALPGPGGSGGRPAMFWRGRVAVGGAGQSVWRQEFEGPRENWGFGGGKARWAIGPFGRAGPVAQFESAQMSLGRPFLIGPRSQQKAESFYAFTPRPKLLFKSDPDLPLPQERKRKGTGEAKHKRTQRRPPQPAAAAATRTPSPITPPGYEEERDRAPQIRGRR